MKATIHVEGNNARELAQGLRAHLAIYEGTAGDTDVSGTDTGGTPAPKAAKGKKAKEPEETFGETETETEEETVEEEQIEEASEYTVEQVRAAFAGYVKKLVKKGTKQETARTQAVALMKKNFKVTRIDDIKPEQYGEAIELVS